MYVTAKCGNFLRLRGRTGAHELCQNQFVFQHQHTEIAKKAFNVSFCLRASQIACSRTLSRRFGLQVVVGFVAVCSDFVTEELFQNKADQRKLESALPEWSHRSALVG
jgi:hypothetical protein